MRRATTTWILSMSHFRPLKSRIPVQTLRSGACKELLSPLDPIKGPVFKGCSSAGLSGICLEWGVNLCSTEFTLNLMGCVALGSPHPLAAGWALVKGHLQGNTPCYYQVRMCFLQKPSASPARDVSRFSHSPNIHLTHEAVHFVSSTPLLPRPKQLRNWQNELMIAEMSGAGQGVLFILGL